MRAALAGGLALALAATLAGAATAAKNLPSTTYVDSQEGYAISIPKTWKLVPRPLANVKKTITSLKKKKSTKPLAAVYSAIVATAAGRRQISAYRFQAFAYPPDPSTPILTEVFVGVVKLSHVYTKKELPAVGAEYANAFSANKGAKIVAPKLVTLPVGPAEFIEGTIPAGAGLQTGIELYLIPHGKRLYELSFQVDGTLLRQATLFTSIAQHFRVA